MPVLHLPVEPGFGQPLFAADRGHRDAQSLSHLFHGESAEEAEFDHFALALVKLRERPKSVVELDDDGAAFGGEVQGFVEGGLPHAMAALLALVAAGILHEELPHEIGRDPVEVAAALPIRQLLLHEPEVGFVDERRGPQRVGIAFPAQIAFGHPAKLAVEQRDQAVARRLVARFPLNQQLRDCVVSSQGRVPPMRTEYTMGFPALLVRQGSHRGHGELVAVQNRLAGAADTEDPVGAAILDPEFQGSVGD